jgi:hypothetical protein
MPHAPIMDVTPSVWQGRRYRRWPDRSLNHQASATMAGMLSLLVTRAARFSQLPGILPPGAR